MHDESPTRNISQKIGLVLGPVVWNLHKRIALTIIAVVKGGPARIVLGFMLASAILSPIGNVVASAMA